MKCICFHNIFNKLLRQSYKVVLLQNFMLNLSESDQVAKNTCHLEHFPGLVSATHKRREIHYPLFSRLAGLQHVKTVACNNFHGLQVAGSV